MFQFLFKMFSVCLCCSFVISSVIVDCTLVGTGNSLLGTVVSQFVVIIFQSLNPLPLPPKFLLGASQQSLSRRSPPPISTGDHRYSHLDPDRNSHPDSRLADQQGYPDNHRLNNSYRYAGSQQSLLYAENGRQSQQQQQRYRHTPDRRGGNNSQQQSPEKFPLVPSCRDRLVHHFVNMDQIFFRSPALQNVKNILY